MDTQDRRAGIEIDLDEPRPATLVFRLRGEEVELDASVVRATPKSLVVELASGAGTLALATARRCEVVMPVPDGEVRLIGRPGRRIDDVPLSNRIELVVTAGPDLTGLL
jgi:hypothetical protein